MDTREVYNANRCTCHVQKHPKHTNMQNGLEATGQLHASDGTWWYICAYVQVCAPGALKK